METCTCKDYSIYTCELNATSNADNNAENKPNNIIKTLINKCCTVRLNAAREDPLEEYNPHTDNTNSKVRSSKSRHIYYCTVKVRYALIMA